MTRDELEQLLKNLHSPDDYLFPIVFIAGVIPREQTWVSFAERSSSRR